MHNCHSTMILIDDLRLPKIHVLILIEMTISATHSYTVLVADGSSICLLETHP